jgi:NADH dehydrogenase (ubiquinone) 1 alpha subcomplex subunit 6
MFRVDVGNNPADVDMLLFKGNEEITTVMSHHYNRHHLITKYVQPESNVVSATDKKTMQMSAFMRNFLNK